jgi:hypothetical protein
LHWAAKSLVYGLGLPHAEGGPADYKTQYSNSIYFNKKDFKSPCDIIFSAYVFMRSGLYLGVKQEIEKGVQTNDQSGHQDPREKANEGVYKTDADGG